LKGFKIITNSVKPFSFISTTTNFEGRNFNKAFIYEDPIVPAPPITKTLLLFISSLNLS